MSRLLVISSPSIDTLHLESGTVHCAGGAGMYSAMAAVRCGVEIDFFAPRPDPCPEILRPVARRLANWMGPEVSPDQLPHFEISYRGGSTEYIRKRHGAEVALSPSMLPEDLSGYDHVHVTPLGGSRLQLEFIRACRQRGGKRLSAGTYPCETEEEASYLQQIIELSDVFFLNEGEAKALFGSLEAVKTKPGKLLFVTRGDQGATVYQGDYATRIPAIPTVEVDPTGAGDTFCGAVLALLLQNKHPVMAARQASILASQMIGQPGPAALFVGDPVPPIPLDNRVRLDDERLKRLARRVSELEEISPFPFTGPVYPPSGHPLALDYFFTTTLQQFCFWLDRDGRYDRPMIAQIGGVQLKGSDYLWEAYRRQIDRDPGFFSPARQVDLSREELLSLYRADNGQDPMPDLEQHLALAHSYGRDMLALELTPEVLLEQALAASQPLEFFLQKLDLVSGYKEDPLRKKSSLLALILSQRPEKFLTLRDDEEVEPVIDYHVMRTCLRTGLVEVLDPKLRHKIAARRILGRDEEWAIRYAAYLVMAQISRLSGRSIGAVDYYFFSSRKRCPEMTDPECARCQLDPVCAHHKELFQPVLRTTFY